MGFLANAIPISASRGSISMNALEQQKGDESSENDSESVLRRVLVKLLRQLSTNYQNSQYQLNINSNYQYQLVSVFTDSFLQKILKLMLVENDVVVRLDAQFIFHSLIDRHKNLDGNFYKSIERMNLRNAIFKQLSPLFYLVLDR